MNDYCTGIAYATGYFANDGDKKYLVVRNLDKWYVENIEKESKYHAYESKHNVDRDGQAQWVIKARDIDSLVPFTEIKCPQDFCRAYIEIHGIIDLAKAKDRKGSPIRRLRLRIYGNEEIIAYINKILPAGEKKIQHIKNAVDEKYTGQTCAIYYQSKAEVLEILKWIDGTPKNVSAWNKWENMLQGIHL